MSGDDSIAKYNCGQKGGTGKQTQACIDGVDKMYKHTNKLLNDGYNARDAIKMSLNYANSVCARDYESDELSFCQQGVALVQEDLQKKHHER